MLDINFDELKQLAAGNGCRGLALVIVKDNSVRLMRELVGNDLLRISLWKKRGATAPKSVVGHGQVEDQAPAVRCVLEVVADLHVAAPLACACRYAVLRADRASGRAEQWP